MTEMKAHQPEKIATRLGLTLALGLVFAGCGGKTAAAPASNDGDLGPRDGGQLVVPNDSGVEQRFDSDAEGSVDSRCDDRDLWLSLTNATIVLGQCAPAVFLPTEKVWGQIVFDADGRAVEVTGMSAARRQDWLDEVANRRWPCLAGQTVAYACRMVD